MHSTLPTNYLPTYLLYELLSHVGNNNFKLNELEKKKLQYFELIEPVLWHYISIWYANQIVPSDAYE